MHYSSIWDEIEHFTPLEFDAPTMMDHRLLTLLDWVRNDAGVPVYITSDFREGDDGAHGEGLAVDISDNIQGNDLSSRWRFKILLSAFSNDICRVGIYDRHLHIDVSTSRAQDVCWIGKSD